ncbi:MAG: T9SS type A sorting domain-containing protein [Flavobacteriales bacterium]
MKKIYLFLFVLYNLTSYAQTITATIAYQGYEETQAYFGQGEYQIYLDNVDGILDKPIILLDGFDPGDTRDFDSLYATLDFNGGNLADTLRDEGFDLVALNAPLYTTEGKDIDGGADYIQRNAMVLIELINQINAQKVGNEELVIIGPSMGGLIARYALSYMEQNSIEHQTRLYISFDSPHLGANIPVSFQYLINYFAKSQDNPDAQAAIDASLNSPASKEMLIDHYLGHLAAGSDFEQDPNLLLPIGAPNFRDAFQAELDALGFPQNVRNVAMVNGSNQGLTTGTPGMQVVNTTLDLGSGITADIIMHFTPEAGQTNTVTDFTAYFAGFPINSYSADAESPSVSSGLDSSPGGFSDLADSLGNIDNPIIIEFLNDLEQGEYCFIPVISALAIDNEDDWYAIPDIGGIHNSPFVNTYIPNENEPHLTLTPQNVEFALDEIRTILGTSDKDFRNKYLLAENPVNEQIILQLNSSYQYNHVELQVFSLTGQEVMSQNYEHINNQITLNHQLTEGVYVLKITDPTTTQEIKFVVR